MIRRRNFLKTAMFGTAAAFAGGMTAWPGRLWAEVRQHVLSKGTKLETLVGDDPATLDPQNLDITPISEFGTMGQTRYELDLNNWRMEISGRLKQPGGFSHADLIGRTSFNRKVLLICPGVFAYYADWTGISLMDMLVEAGLDPSADRVEISGPEGSRRESKTFPMEDVRNGKILLAHGVNGVPLPEAHGYPLRVVAEGYYGHDWVKYADRIRVL